MPEVSEIEEEEIPIEATFSYFASAVLRLPLYGWQEDVVGWYDTASVELVQGSIATPNGSGKSSRIIPTLALGWLAFYPKGRVVCTSADGKQIDSQVMPAIEEHRNKFPDWKFIEREIHTPTGGWFLAYSTDDEGRSEGYHKFNDDDGPLLIIIDEGKSVPDKIYRALDRCTYNAILITSSPGKMNGHFYETQFRPELGFNATSVGLKDCPHITSDKIKRIVDKYGANSPFTRSSLYGEFIEIYDGSPVYYAYNMAAHEQEELPWLYGATIVIGLDAGTRNASVIAGVIKDKNGHTFIYVYREIFLTGSDTDRQAVELLRVLAEEFPFWNSQSPACPNFLFFCDPAFKSSSFTKRGSGSSPMAVLHSHKIYPGYKHGLHLQPSIAVINRVLQQHHMVEVVDFKTQERSWNPVWHFQINKNACPMLADGFRGRLRYPAEGEAGYSKDNDAPLKGDMVQSVDHPHDALRYLVNGVMAIAEENHRESETAKYPAPSIDVEPKRMI